MAYCQDRKSLAVKKFAWQPTESAPKAYPIEIYRGIITCEDGSTVNIPSGGRTVHNGWGETGSTYVVGDDVKSIPKTLHITWLSFIENQFYTGNFPLPVEQIKKLFETGYTDHLGKKQTYSSVVVGMAPKGHVSVWLLGADKSVEIGHFKAHQTTVSMQSFNPSGIQDRAKYVADTLAYWSEKEDTYQEGKADEEVNWSIFRSTYPWKLDYQFTHTGTPAEIRVKFFNGTHFYFKTSNPEIRDYTNSALPKAIGYKWYDEDHNKFGADITFDHQETMSAFKTLFSHTDIETATLSITVDNHNQSVELVLSSTEDSVKLSNTTIKVYSTSD
ncbi:DUF2931 family protein [Alteromonas sp. C1M14]|uniref:DUF2931 family protein n=1 Tax=Alteromonas sp. C1M14 TaxID=2841567 RepID=UPI001C092FD4|nr:DUF2931 family protein [Alteromonas sp. C1M14]MBU2979790.1 DUF2931 family protein [Alteromonas sp. C1M14]